MSTGLSMAALVHHIHHGVIFNKFLRYWIDVFHSPHKIVTHKDAFDDYSIKELREKYETKVGMLCFYL